MTVLTGNIDEAAMGGAALPAGRTVIGVLVCAALYYLATRTAWLLTLPHSKISLFFPPHAVMVAILLLVPTRHWWAYVLAALASHFIASQQADWPPLVALESEAFDALKIVLTAAGIRLFIKAPFRFIDLREAVLFMLIAVILVPFGTAFWGAASAVGDRSGAEFWLAWRDFGMSNGVAVIVLVPCVLVGAELWKAGLKPSSAMILEACLLAAGLLVVGWLAFDRAAAGPETTPALLYTPIPLLIWAALRFGLGGMSASLLLVTVMAIWGTMHGRGPFLLESPSENAFALQSFILVVAAAALLLAVAIEDERRSKERLRLTEQRMSMAAESAQLALWDWDLVRDVVWVQDWGLFGFPPDTPIDHATLGGSVHTDDRTLRDVAIQRAIANGGNYESEFRVILADGSVRWISARGRSPSPVASGAPERILGIAMDITRQKKVAEDAQLQREELAHLSRVATMSALSGSLAHELHQPLTSIMVNTHAGQSIAGHEMPDLAEVRATFADIESSTTRAGEIIERMRTLLRRGVVALQPVGVKAILDELLQLTRTDLIARGVSVTDATSADLPPVMADRVQLQQILLNLIKNAGEAMQANAPDDRKLTLTTQLDQDELRIGVLDCGVGLPEDVESLFQPFHSTKEGGLGMGLSICRILVSAHGGRLWGERRSGRGAAFYVALPLAPVRNAATTADSKLV